LACPPQVTDGIPAEFPLGGMMSKFYDRALEAINEMFSDRSVSVDETRRNLKSLISEIEVMLDALGEEE